MCYSVCTETSNGTCLCKLDFRLLRNHFQCAGGRLRRAEDNTVLQRQRMRADCCCYVGFSAVKPGHFYSGRPPLAVF